MLFSLAWKRWRPLATATCIPESFYGHLIAMLEIMVGMFGLAVITGLIFVRFSRPTARIHFSKVAVIAPFDGVPNLMIRVANLRHQAMVEAEFRMTSFETISLQKETMCDAFFLSTGIRSFDHVSGRNNGTAPD